MHNAAAGYWSIATGAMAPCQVLCAYDASFAAGLLEALAQVALARQPVLLIAYDSEYPEPLHAKRDTPRLRRRRPAAERRAQRASRWRRSASARPATQPRSLADAGLEALRTSIPALRALPLLKQLANGERGSVCLDYLPPMQLRVDVEPC